MTKCSNYKRYKGLRKPQCLAGQGCESCLAKYRESKFRWTAGEPWGPYTRWLAAAHIGDTAGTALLTVLKRSDTPPESYVWEIQLPGYFYTSTEFSEQAAKGAAETRYREITSALKQDWASFKV